MGDEKKGNNIIIQIILLVIGTFLGIGGTLFVQKLQENETKKTLHGKLFEEIKYNSNKGSLMETTGNFTKFESSAWENFKGTSAFYDIPTDIRKPLDSYYFILKLYNEGIIQWKQKDEKEKDEFELKMRDMSKLTDDYVRFLFEKKILKKENFTDGR